MENFFYDDKFYGYFEDFIESIEEENEFIKQQKALVLDSYNSFLGGIGNLGDTLKEAGDNGVGVIGAMASEFANAGTEAINLYSALDDIKESFANGDISEATADLQTNVTVVLAVITQITKGIATIIKNFSDAQEKTHSLEVAVGKYGANSLEAKAAQTELNNSFADGAKVIPVLGEALAMIHKSIININAVTPETVKIFNDLGDAVNKTAEKMQKAFDKAFEGLQKMYEAAAKVNEKLIDDWISASEKLTKKLQDQQAADIKAREDNAKKIQDINSKNYDAVITIKTKESQKKIDLLKSEIATELDLIQNKQKRLDQLEADRQLSQEQKRARAAAFAANEKQTIQSADFYRIANANDFERNYQGGNANLRDAAQRAYDQGGSRDDYAKAKVLAGTRQFQYYSYLAQNEHDLGKQNEYLELAEQGRKEAEDWLIDAEKAKIENYIIACESHERISTMFTGKGFAGLFGLICIAGKELDAYFSKEKKQHN